MIPLLCHDALIIGGGPAGSTLAIVLANAGRQVVLIEKSKQAQHKVCGEFLSPESLPLLRHNGIDPERLGARTIHSVRVAARDFLAEVPLPAPALSLTRRVLDEALLRRAQQAGVSLLRGYTTESLSHQPGREASDLWRAQITNSTHTCKTEASQKPVPLDEYTARDLLEWYRVTPYREPDNWVFTSNSSRAGRKRGKQPLWLQSIMRYHIQPVVKRLGINKRVSRHTFRRTYTSLLTANKEDVKVVQELLRHGSSRITLDIYAQAQMPAKRAAQQKVVEMYGHRRPCHYWLKKGLNCSPKSSSAKTEDLS